jgi:hypothetical protein
MKNSEVPIAALRRAVQLCDGLDALGDTLNVSTDALERMLAGEEEVPQPLFVQIVGILLEVTATRSPRRSTRASRARIGCESTTAPITTAIGSSLLRELKQTRNKSGVIRNPRDTHAH